MEDGKKVALEGGGGMPEIFPFLFGKNPYLIDIGTVIDPASPDMIRS